MILALVLLAIWLVLVLAIPKRTFGTSRERLRQVAQGEREYLFAPPPWLGDSPLRQRASEALRLIEMGLPIYLLALRAESQGRARRAAPEFHPDGCPPAEKARPEGVPQYVMPPIAWRREWEALLLREDQELPPLLSALPVPQPPETQAAHVLQIRTLGTFQLLVNTQDLAPQLLRHPTLSFLWLFLLSHQALDRKAPVHRQLLAEETFPGLDSDQQRSRLRRRLSDLPRVLPQALAERIQAEGDYLRFGLEGVGFDIAALQAVVTTWEGTGMLPAEGLHAVEAAAAAHGGEYLPIWEELEQEVTRGRGAAGELVRRIRQVTDDAYAQLILRLAHHHLARRDPPRAVPLLEEALRRRPEREDTARLLVAAYRETGQTNRARQLDSTYFESAAEPRARGKRETPGPNQVHDR